MNPPTTPAAELGAAIKADAHYIAEQPGNEAWQTRLGLYVDRLVAMAEGKPEPAPVPTPAGWGSADLSRIATDTYALAQQWYRVVVGNIGSGPTADLFTQGAAYARSQLAQLVGGIVGAGARYWPVDVYPVIPPPVIAAAGPDAVTAAHAAQAATAGQGTYVARPEAASLGL